MSQSLKWLAIESIILRKKIVASWRLLACRVKGGGDIRKQIYFWSRLTIMVFQGCAPHTPTKSRPYPAPQKLAKPLEQSGVKLISIYGNYKKRYHFFSINVCLIALDVYVHPSRGRQFYASICWASPQATLENTSRFLPCPTDFLPCPAGQVLRPAHPWYFSLEVKPPPKAVW